MKIACIGDIHCNLWKEYSKTIFVSWNVASNRYEQDSFGVPINSRLLAQLDALCDIREYCVQQEIPLVLIAGDIFHTRGSVHTSVFNHVYQVLISFKKVGLDIIMIAGNHDQIDSSIVPENSLFAFQTFADVVSSPRVIPYKYLNETIEICAIPYSKDKKFIKSYLDDYVDNKNTKFDSILLAHLGISGGLTGSGNYVMSDSWNLNELRASKFKYCIFGHYHKPQFLADWCAYVGSPLQNNFNDEGCEHGFMVIDTDRRWDMELIPLHYPQFISISTKNAKLINSDVISSNYIRVLATASESQEVIGALEELQLQPETWDNNVRLEIEKDISANARDTEISVSMSDEDILKTYVKEQTVKADILSDILSYGLSILHSVLEAD